MGVGHPKGTADDAPEFGSDRDRRNPDMSIIDIYAEDGDVWVQTGGMHEPYSVDVAGRIRDRLDDAIDAANGDQ